MGGTRHSDQGRATATCRDGAAGRRPGRRRGRRPADPGARGRCEGSGLRVIVLDTNVIAEILRPSPEARVVDWLTSLTGGVAITSVTLRSEERRVGKGCGERGPGDGGRERGRQGHER